MEQVTRSMALICSFSLVILNGVCNGLKKFPSDHEDVTFFF